MSCSTTRQLALLSIVSDCNRTKYSNIMQQKSFPEEHPTVAYVHDEAYKQMLNHVAFSYSSPRWGNPDGCFITAKFTDGSQCVSPSSPPLRPIRPSHYSPSPLPHSINIDLCAGFTSITFCDQLLAWSESNTNLTSLDVDSFKRRLFASYSLARKKNSSAYVTTQVSKKC